MADVRAEPIPLRRPRSSAEVGAPEPGWGTVTLLAADADGGDIAPVTALLTEVAERHHGLVIDGGAGVALAAFGRASDALECAAALVLPSTGVEPPRAALHTGELTAALADAGSSAAGRRVLGLLSLAHPGQVLLSRAAHDVVVDVAPGALGLFDLGEHRPRSGTRAEHVWQALVPGLPATFPPLRSSPQPPTNLPVPLTPIIGREGDTADLIAALSDARLVTLAGVGGTGKTRLAVEAGARVAAEHADGTWFVELAAVDDADDAAALVRTALGAPDVGGEPALETVLGHLRQRRALLVLDNCEHVIDAAAAIALAVVEQCPHVTVLATSREPLGIAGEVVVRVPSLSPDAAFELFCERAQQSGTGFTADDATIEAIREICARVDGIPLAIELAAARTRVLSPREIAEGLHDQFRMLAGGSRVTLARQQTIEASVDWSHRLLSERERLVLRRLAVLPGEFGLTAAEQVCTSDGMADAEVLDALGSLVDKSLVLARPAGGATRYRLLETIRQYAARRLVEANETDVARERLLLHAEAVVAQWHRDLVGHGQAEARDALSSELPTILSALTWAVDTGRVARAAAVVLDLFPLWDQRDTPAELGRLYEGLLAAELPDARVRDAILAAAAKHAFPAADARALADAALAGPIDPTWRATALLVDAGMRLLESEESLAVMDAAVDAARESGEAWLVAMSMSIRSSSQLDDLGAAGEDAASALAIAEQAGNAHEARRARVMLADIHRRAGRLRTARQLFERVAAESRAHETLADAQLATYLGYTLVDLGQVDAARRHLLAARDRWHGIGFGEHKAIEALAYAACAADDPAQGLAAVDEIARSHPNPIMRGGAGIDLVHALLALGDAERAEASLVAIERDLGALAGSTISRLEVTPLRARLALLIADLESAELRAHEELELAVTHDLPRLHVLGLEHLAEVMIRTASCVEGVRLAAAASAGRAVLGYVALPYERRAQEAAMAEARDALGVPAFDAARAEGARLTLDAATDLARRGRGRRSRPKTGWSSLTPAELRVADLVAEGLTNPQVGERLFISPKTVRAHLSSIFAKLGIASRAQLAGEVTRRQLS